MLLRPLRLLSLLRLQIESRDDEKAHHLLFLLHHHHYASVEMMEWQTEEPQDTTGESAVTEVNTDNTTKEERRAQKDF